MLRTLCRIRRLPSGLRACSLSTNALLAVKPADQNTTTASLSETQVLYDAGPPGRSASAAGQTAGQTAEDGQSAAAYASTRPSAGIAHGGAPWRRTAAAQADHAAQHSATANNFGTQTAVGPAAAFSEPRHRRGSSREPRPAGQAQLGAAAGKAAAPAAEGARRRCPKTQPPYGVDGVNVWRPEQVRPRRGHAQQPAPASGQPVSPTARDGHSRPGADPTVYARTPAQRHLPKPSHAGPATVGGPQRAVQHVPDSEKAQRRTELRNLAERLKARLCACSLHCIWLDNYSQYDSLVVHR